MTGEQWTRLKEVFAQALEQPAAERRAWVARACAGDFELGTQVGALLDAHDEDPSFLEQPIQVDPSDIAEALGAPSAGGVRQGTVLSGKYQIIGEIGHGGMGIVYVAQDLRLPRRVALKALPESTRHDPLRLERFRREAWAVAKVSHPNVATILAFEELDGQPFIVSEYVRGTALRNVLEQGAGLSPGRALAIATDMARALAAAHAEGIVHRDLKPENVLLTEEGHVKVVDFGIAQLSRDDVPALTQTGSWVGTPAYMAPEQIEGGSVDGRADIFSFGLILAEMLTGQHPLRPASTASPARQPGGTTRVRLATDSIPEPIRGIVTRCLHVLPSERYGSARELLHDLDRARGVATEPDGRRPARWWWEFHQAATALVYIVMAIVAWNVRDQMRQLAPSADSVFTVTLLATVIVSAILRLNLWFTSRFFPDQLSRVRQQRRVWILAADVMFIATLVCTGLLLLVLQDVRQLSLVLVALGIGAAVALLLIEPVTARAAFGETTA